VAIEIVRPAIPLEGCDVMDAVGRMGDGWAVMGWWESRFFDGAMGGDGIFVLLGRYPNI